MTIFIAVLIKQCEPKQASHNALQCYRWPGGIICRLHPADGTCLECNPTSYVTLQGILRCTALFGAAVCGSKTSWVTSAPVLFSQTVLLLLSLPFLQRFENCNFPHAVWFFYNFLFCIAIWNYKWGPEVWIRICPGWFPFGRWVIFTLFSLMKDAAENPAFFDCIVLQGSSWGQWGGRRVVSQPKNFSLLYLMSLENSFSSDLAVKTKSSVSFLLLLTQRQLKSFSLSHCRLFQVLWWLLV